MDINSIFEAKQGNQLSRNKKVTWSGEPLLLKSFLLYSLFYSSFVRPPYPKFFIGHKFLNKGSSLKKVPKKRQKGPVGHPEAKFPASQQNYRHAVGTPHNYTKLQAKFGQNHTSSFCDIAKTVVLAKKIKIKKG